MNRKLEQHTHTHAHTQIKNKILLTPNCLNSVGIKENHNIWLYSLREEKWGCVKHFKMWSIMFVWAFLLLSFRAKFRMQCRHHFFCVSPCNGAHSNLTRKKNFSKWAVPSWTDLFT